jgi:hypothetical protein
MSQAAFPVGDQRQAVGQVSPGSPVKININYKGSDEAKKLRITFWGTQGRKTEQYIDVTDSVVVDLSQEAIDIQSHTYTLYAIFDTGEERLICKGRVWLKDTN